jgi:hypothetical protein
VTPTVARHVARRALEIVTVAVLALAVGLYAVRWLFVLLDLDQTEYGEGPLLAFSRRWLETPIAPGWLSDFPMSLTAYGPTFAWLWKTSIALAPSADPLLVGRVLAGLCGVFLIGFVAVAAHQHSRSAAASLLAVLVVISSPIVPQFFAHARVDTMASLCVALAYLTIDSTPTRLVYAALFVVLGSTVKQTAALHLIPLALVTLFAYGPRTAARFAGTATTIGALLWAPLIAFRDGFFWTAAVQSNLNLMNIWQGYEITYRAISSPSFVVVLVASWLYIVEQGTAVLRDRWLVGFLWSLGVATLFSLKAGSSVNYFIDALWLGSLVVAHLAGRYLAEAPSRSHLGICVAASIALVPPLMTLQAAHWLPRYAEPRLAAVRAAIAPGVPVLADGHLVGHVERAGGRALVNDPFVFRLMADDDPSLGRRGAAALSHSTVVLLDTPIEERLREDTAKRAWPLDVLKTISQQFCLTESMSELYVYRSLSQQMCVGSP